MRFMTSPTSPSTQISGNHSTHRKRLVRNSVLTMALILAIAGTTPGQNEEAVLARVNGVAITQKEVDDSQSARILPVQQQLYALRKVALDNIVVRRLLESEAEKRKVSVAELRKQLMEGPINVSQAAVDTAYEQNSSFFATMSPDEARERLRLDLETQARMKNYRVALEKLRSISSIVINLTPPVIKKGADDAGSPALGAASPIITIVEFSDFQCPFCAAVQPTLKQILQEYSGTVKLVFRHLPLEIHPHAMPAARAAYCAGQQGRFWQYHDELFTTKNLSAESFNLLAKNLGLNLQTFQTCLNSADSLNAITNDVETARRLRIESTPSFVINDRVVSGAISFGEFERIINLELQRTSAKGSSSN